MVIPTYKCIYQIVVINVSYNVIYYVNSNENTINIYILNKCKYFIKFNTTQWSLKILNGIL